MKKYLIIVNGYKIAVKELTNEAVKNLLNDSDIVIREVKKHA